MAIGGIRPFLVGIDEWHFIWNWLEQPESFTPAAFNVLWDSFPTSKKIDYVLSLIGGERHV